MIKNFFLTAIRNLYKQKAYFFINVLGLAIGLASFIFISIYVLHELSYDKFHSNHENIYRVFIKGEMSGQSLDGSTTASPMAAALLNDYPEVENVARIGRFGTWIVGHENKTFIEDHFLFADSSFFNIFDFKLIEGDPNKALTHPRSVVLTESSAKKYFGDENPMGKLLKVEQDTVFYKVTGIAEDAPENSHIQFDMIGSLITLRVSRDRGWVNHNMQTYIALKEGTSPDKFRGKMQKMIEVYVGPQIKEILGLTMEQFKELGNYFGYFLNPITDIHLKSNLPDELETGGNIVYVQLFSIIALLILLIAIINFVNLSTAKSTTRAKEVGIRKTIGAKRKALIYQFIGESVLLSIVAIIIAILLISLFSTNFNQLVGQELPGLFSTPLNLVYLFCLAVIVGIIAGIYPAFVLSAFQPIKVLKGRISTGAKSGWLRSSLVVFQFTISISIIIGTIVIYKQLNYIQSKDLGFNKEELLILKRPDALRKKIESFKKELLSNTYILGVSNSRTMPGKEYAFNGKQKMDDPENNLFLLMQNRVSLEYPKLMGFELAQGRFFSKEYGTDSLACIVNEETVKLLQYDDPLNSYIVDFSGNGTVRRPIIGVLKNFHLETLHKKIQPSIMTVMPYNVEGYMQIRLNTSNLKNTLAFIEDKWNEYIPQVPFQYFFFDEEYKQNYQYEIKTGQIFGTFAILAIFIACLGLLGLITYTAAVRTKEIGIRKAHGATLFNIIKLLSGEIVKLILISTFISWTIAYFWIEQWLNNFAFHVSIGPGVYIVSTIIALIIGWIAISFQTIKVGLSNPVDALRYE